ncbi:hypothetical protein B2J93_8417 [Marssonina coronariae]|uniref:BTB domain-containing protein n=1 Tax=Diplocarpon coronariae TaxID=2795749 RepID=A0A218ZA46_9HELO|nr:hypothetical protein B2J93_8417 [Marssonina coronariae]
MASQKKKTEKPTGCQFASSEGPPAKRQMSCSGKSRNRTVQRTDDETDNGVKALKRKQTVIDITGDDAAKSSQQMLPPKLQTRLKPSGLPGTSFPRFPDGDVIIMLQPGVAAYSFQLHSSILANASMWFEQTLSLTVHEADAARAAKAMDRYQVQARYELHYDSSLKAHVLARSSFTEAKSLSLKSTKSVADTKADFNSSKASPGMSCPRDLQPLQRKVRPAQKVTVGKEDQAEIPGQTEITAGVKDELASKMESKAPAVDEAPACPNNAEGSGTKDNDAACRAVVVEKNLASKSGSLDNEQVDKEELTPTPSVIDVVSTVNSSGESAYYSEISNTVSIASEQAVMEDADLTSASPTSIGKCEPLPPICPLVADPITGENASRSMTLPIDNNKQHSEKGTPSVSVSVSATKQDHITKRVDASALAAVSFKDQPPGPFAQASHHYGARPDKRPKFDFLEGHANLFLAYYNMPLEMDTVDIGIALDQAELLVDVARFYGSIHIVRPHINNALMQFGKDLYLAIMDDPPRWMHLAVYLESAPIFREGVVHVVGNFPVWVWSSFHPQEMFSPVLEIMEKKLKDLKALKAAANTSLITTSVLVGGTELSINSLSNATMISWSVVQQWRDWFAGSLARGNGKADEEKNRVHAQVYRTLRKGGDSYLPIQQVLEQLEAIRSEDQPLGTAERKQVEKDLHSIKKSAQKQVALLCVNNSMLPVERAGIEWFTCVNVENKEMPWAKPAGMTGS